MPWLFKCFQSLQRNFFSIKQIIAELITEINFWNLFYLNEFTVREKS